MDAAVTTLTALAVFSSTIEQGAVRSVHAYKVVGRKAGVGWVRWEKWVEREFVLSARGCREVGVPDAAPRILPVPWRGRPAFREGLAVGPWRCIVAYDSAAGVAPSAPPPPLLTPSGNPQLKCLPNLYNDLEKVFQFQTAEKVPELIRCDSKKQTIHRGQQERTKCDSESDSDEDSQSDQELQPPVQKHQRANRKHIDSITLVDIAQYFHLPIREASKTLEIGVSVLKRKCRQYGIPRWPHRKIKSLDALIHDLEDVLNDEPSDDMEKKKKQKEKERQKEMERQAFAIRALTRRKRMLETEKKTIQQKPALDLMTETKLFREDVFKRRYRAKSAGIYCDVE